VFGLLFFYVAFVVLSSTTADSIGMLSRPVLGGLAIGIAGLSLLCARTVIWVWNRLQPGSGDE